MIGSNLQIGKHGIQAILKTIFGALLAPLFLLLTLVTFLIALADFTCFRIRKRLHGTPPSKSVWEF